MRIDPPPSLPMASGHRPAATAAAAPELEPPEFRDRSQGLRVTPNRLLMPEAMSPKSGIVVLPTTIAPASFSRATTGASKLSSARSALNAMLP